MPHGGRRTKGRVRRKAEFPPPGVKPCRRRRRHGIGRTGGASLRSGLQRLDDAAALRLRARPAHQAAASPGGKASVRRARPGRPERARRGRSRTAPAPAAGESNVRTRRPTRPPPGPGQRPIVVFAYVHLRSEEGKAADASADAIPLNGRPRTHCEQSLSLNKSEGISRRGRTVRRGGSGWKTEVESFAPTGPPARIARPRASPCIKCAGRLQFPAVCVPTDGDRVRNRGAGGSHESGTGAPA